MQSTHACVSGANFICIPVFFMAFTREKRRGGRGGLEDESRRKHKNLETGSVHCKRGRALSEHHVHPYGAITGFANEIKDQKKDGEEKKSGG